MPTETRLNAPFATALDLPPAFRLVTLREVGDAFAHAKANAAELGAGTLVYVGRFDLAEFAVVLEPDEPLRTARRAFYAGMAALADALAAHAPPEKPIAFDWPDAIHVDRGLVGGGQLAWPDGPEDEPPDWLVFGGMIRTVSMAEGEPGLRPLSAALEEEGFDDVGSGAAGRELRAPSDGAYRRLAGVRISPRSRRAICRGSRRKRACAATSTTTAICWCGAWARPTSSAGSSSPALAAPTWLDPATRRAAVKLLRTIRLDPSDTFVFERAAEPGEWAVSGAFVFADDDPAKLEGKARAAFRCGFLGVAVARLVDAGADRGGERGRPPRRDRHAGASSSSRISARPTMAAARRGGRRGIRIRRLALQPSARHADRGAPHARGRRNPRGVPHACVRADGPKPLRAFAFLEVEGEEEPAEKVDLAALAKRRAEASEVMPARDGILHETRSDQDRMPARDDIIDR